MDYKKMSEIRSTSIKSQSVDDIFIFQALE